MEINRELQNELLTFLLKCYPEPVNHGLKTLLKIAGSEQALAGNIMYFQEHGLVTPNGVIVSVDGHIQFNSSALKLTAKGADFITADGGISAILNTVTFKIHKDSLARLELLISQAPLDPSVKEKALSQLKSLPADAIKHVGLKLTESALENSPKVAQLLQTCVDFLVLHLY